MDPWTRLRLLILKRRLDAEMADEMRHHLELQNEKHIASGMSEAQARTAAEREFGNLGVVQQQARDDRGWRAVDELVADL